jgi:hypothetical protein
MAEAPGMSEKGIARLMVRRHLRSWITSDIISEELLVAMFIRSMKHNPDRSMQDIARWVDAEIREIVGIILGQPIDKPIEPAGYVQDEAQGLDPG